MTYPRGARLLLVVGLLVAWATGAAAAPTTSAGLLDGVTSFLCQLQDLDLAAVRETCYDLVIIDYSSDGGEASEFTAAEIAALADAAAGPKIVLSYMSIGEAEEYRFYWRDGWTPGEPSWLDAENPDWAGNFTVRYWEEDWQAIILEYTDRLLDAGFDGAYLDRIDVYEEYERRGRSNAAAEMVAFVEAIHAHAAARNPDFLLVVQNAAELADRFPEYLEIVDGIGQEDIHYGYVEDDTPTPAAVTREMQRHLDTFRAAGKLVLTIDYATTPAWIDDAYAKSRERGYVPLVTTRALDRLIVHPGHDPCTTDSTPSG